MMKKYKSQSFSLVRCGASEDSGLTHNRSCQVSVTFCHEWLDSYAFSFKMSRTHLFRFWNSKLRDTFPCQEKKQKVLNIIHRKHSGHTPGHGVVKAEDSTKESRGGRRKQQKSHSRCCTTRHACFQNAVACKQRKALLRYKAMLSAQDCVSCALDPYPLLPGNYCFPTIFALGLFSIMHDTPVVIWCAQRINNRLWILVECKVIIRYVLPHIRSSHGFY